MSLLGGPDPTPSQVRVASMWPGALGPGNPLPLAQATGAPAISTQRAAGRGQKIPSSLLTWGRRQQIGTVLATVGILTICLWLFGLINSSAMLSAYATAMLALGTIGLAAGTVGLYLEQRSELEVARQHANAAEKQVEIAVNTLQTSIRPWLANTGGLTSIVTGSADISVETYFFNVGNGLAVIMPDKIKIGATGLNHIKTGRAAMALIDPGRSTCVSFRFLERDTLFEEMKNVINRHDRFSFRFTYTDAANGQMVTLVSYCEFDGHSWRVAELDYYNGGEVQGEPFLRTQVGPSTLA